MYLHYVILSMWSHVFQAETLCHAYDAISTADLNFHFYAKQLVHAVHLPNLEQTPWHALVTSSFL